MRLWRVIDGVQFDACLPETIGNLRLLYRLDDPTLPIVCPFTKEVRDRAMRNNDADYIVLDKNGWYFARHNNNTVVPTSSFFPSSNYWTSRGIHARVPATPVVE